MVSGLAGRVGHRVSGRTSSEDSSTRNPEAEARPARRRFVVNAAPRGSLPRDLDALDRTAGLANLAAGSAPVDEDANAIAAHLASDRTQSRLAARPGALECSGAKRTAGTASATLYRSETDSTTKVVGTAAETNQGTGLQSWKKTVSVRLGRDNDSRIPDPESSRMNCVRSSSRPASSEQNPRSWRRAISWMPTTRAYLFALGH